jgi:hypothetical protein
MRGIVPRTSFMGVIMKSTLFKITAIALVAASLSGCIIISREVVSKPVPAAEAPAN